MAVQPTIAPLCFARYANEEIVFSQDAKARRWARVLFKRFEQKKIPVSDTVFVGRIGRPRSFGMATRSIRKPLAELVIVDERR